MKKILVCEDEQVIREFVVINLKRAGYEAYEAENGEQALEIYEREGGDFDVAVLDIMMPGKYDGLAVCKELRKRSGTIGIILLTAKTQEMDKVSGLMMGADDYMTKPFSPSELVARVDAIYRRVALAEMRTENNFKEEIHSGEFSLNLRNRYLLKRGQPIESGQQSISFRERTQSMRFQEHNLLLPRSRSLLASKQCSPNRSVSVSTLNVVSRTPALAPPIPAAYARPISCALPVAS